MNDTASAATDSVGVRAPAPEPAPNLNPIEGVASILNEAMTPPGEPEPQQQEPEPEPEPEPQAADPEPEPQPEPKAINSLKELAEAAGVDIKTLYGLEVGLGNGEAPVTLGDLKDKVKAGIDLEARETEILQQSQAFENQTLRAAQEFGEAMKLANVTPEMLERGRQEFERKLATEQAKLWDAVPSLADPDFRKQAHSDVVEMAADYGISANEVNNLADHRHYKMAMDYAALRKRVAAANPSAKKAKKGTQAGSGVAQKGTGNNAGLIETAKRTGLVKDQVNAIASILGTVK